MEQVQIDFMIEESRNLLEPIFNNPVVKRCRWCKEKFTFESGDFNEAMKYCCDNHYRLAVSRKHRRQMAGLNKGRK